MTVSCTWLVTLVAMHLALFSSSSGSQAHDARSRGRY